MTQSRASASSAATTKSGLNYPNPSLRLDSQLGLVVIEFFNSSGAVSRTIPSSQQLAAYQQWNETGSGSNPLTGAPSTTAAAPALRQVAPQSATASTAAATVAPTAGTASAAGAGNGGTAPPVTAAADAATINVDTGSAAFVPVGGPSAATTNLTPAAVSAPAPAAAPTPAPAPAPLPAAPAAGTTGLPATH